MQTFRIALILSLISSVTIRCYSQVPERVKAWFPAGTTFHQNIPYAGDTLKKHLLDIYLPPNAKSGTPLVDLGSWWCLAVNDKYSDMGI